MKKTVNLTYGMDAIRARYQGSNSEISGFFDVFDPLKEYRFVAPIATSASPPARWLPKRHGSSL